MSLRPRLHQLSLRIPLTLALVLLCSARGVTHINSSPHFETCSLFKAVLEDIDRALLLEQLRLKAGHGLL